MRENKTTDTLTYQERSALKKYEVTINRGLDWFIEVGNALAEIRDKRLYRQEFGSFEAYLDAKWPRKLSLSRAYQLIGAAEVARNLCTIVDPSELRESHLRPLAGKSPDVQRAAWLKGGEGKEGRPRTGKDIQAAVQALTRPADVPAQITPPLELVEAARGLAESLNRFTTLVRLHPGCQGFTTETLDKLCSDARAFRRTLQASAN